MYAVWFGSILNKKQISKSD